MTKPIDAFIFDMDGTLWDAVASYAKVWDETARRLGIVRKPVQYSELVCLMGKPLHDIYDAIIPNRPEMRSAFLDELIRTENELMPVIGGTLYPEVHDTLSFLSDKLSLFMISNCSGQGLSNFINFCGLNGLFTDTLTYGETGEDKDVNILTIKDKYNLSNPIYVGDIQRDCDSAHKAGTLFAWVTYGFGKVSNPDFTINHFSELKSLIKL